MLAILYMFAFTAAGIDMGNRIFADRPPQIRIWLGAVLGEGATIEELVRVCLKKGL